MYYTKTCNKLAGPVFVFLPPGYNNNSIEMFSAGKTLRLVLLARDSNLRPLLH